MKNDVCKICRRRGQKLFLKGEKCLSPKCPFIKRPYPPGQKAKKGRFSFSQYAKELSEKQKLKNYYGLSERQFAKYVKDVLEKRGRVEDAVLFLITNLEKRFDNVIFRAGFAKSRREARELVGHSHFLVNNKPVNIPSFSVGEGMTISLKDTKKNKMLFKNTAITLKNQQALSWLRVDIKKMEIKVAAKPNIEDVGSSVDVSSIFEFYSR